MSQGNQGVQYWYGYHGSPVGLAHAIFNAPQNSLVIDTLNNVIRIKTSPRGDNSGYLTVGILGAPLVLTDTATGIQYALTSNGGQPRLVQQASEPVPPGVVLEPAAQVTDTATGLPVSFFIQGGELKIGSLPTPQNTVPILTDAATGVQYQITVTGGQIRLVETVPQ